MARLEPVHVLELDRATSKMEVVRINPTRSFSAMGEHGALSYTWQNGKWFGQGGQEIDPAEVPQEYLEAMRATPVVIADRGPKVVWTCEFCGQSMNSSEKDEHLIGHVRETLAAAGKTPQPPKVESHPEERPRARAAS
jgi:hypothetical protein